MQRATGRSASRSSSGSFQMRCIIVGTAYSQSTRCSSTSCERRARRRTVRHDRRRGCRAAAPPVEKPNGPLWYSGPVHEVHAVLRHARTATRRGIAPSVTAGPPATISFGRPVLPPEVGAFHAGGDLRGQRRVGRSRVRLVARRGRTCGPGAAGRGRRRATESASSMIASSSRRRQLGATGCGRRAELPDRDGRLEELDPVRQPDGDERVLRDAELGVGAGQPVGARVELAPG